MVALSLVLLGLVSALFSLFLHRVDGDEVLEDQGKHGAESAAQVLVKELNGLQAADLEDL